MGKDQGVGMEWGCFSRESTAEVVIQKKRIIIKKKRLDTWSALAAVSQNAVKDLKMSSLAGISIRRRRTSSRS